MDIYESFYRKMVRQNVVLPYLTQKWYGNCRAVRTDGAAHGESTCYTQRSVMYVAYFVYMFVLHSRLLIAEVKVRGNCVPPPPVFSLHSSPT